jgi:hypothetical protein
MSIEEDWACPQCGRDDYRCKCDWPMPSYPIGIRKPPATKTSVGQDEADA